MWDGDHRLCVTPSSQSDTSVVSGGDVAAPALEVAMRRRSPTYQPPTGADLSALCRAAFLCGRDLSPRDRRANWIDALTGAEYQEVVEAYHDGQSASWEGNYDAEWQPAT